MMGFCTIFALAVICLIAGVHKIEQGHVGIYYYQGKLQLETVGPGYHAMIPFMTRYESIQVNVQTDLVRNIPCGTSGGVVITFDKIEVVNRLKKESVYQTIKNYTSNYDKIWIYDKIHHEINQFCSKHTLMEIYIELFDKLDEELIIALKRDLELWSPGVEILAVRITKPIIPETIRVNFETMEAQRSQMMLALQNRNLLVQEAQTSKQQKIIQASSELEVSQIQVQRSIEEMKNSLEIAQLQNQMYIDQQRAVVDSDYSANLKIIETSENQLNDEYLENQLIQALLSKLTLVLGESIPEYFSLNDFKKNK